jgi:hypothetical protein
MPGSGSFVKRTKITIVAVTIPLLLSSVASADNAAFVNAPDSSGFTAPNGAPYTSGGKDPRMSAAVQNMMPQDPNNPTPAERQRLSFAESLQDFQLLRYDIDSSSTHRFGKRSFSFRVLRKTQNGQEVVITFRGNLTDIGNIVQWDSVTGDRAGYSLEGSITDGPKMSIGTIILRSTENTATIFYRAYTASMKVHRDVTADLSRSPELEDLIQKIEGCEYVWAVNMTVPMGVSRFLYDIITNQDSESLISFSGDSTQTGDVDAIPSAIDATGSVAGRSVKSILLVGDSYDDQRTFSVQLKGNNGDSTEVMIDLDRSSPAPETLLPP